MWICCASFGWSWVVAFSFCGKNVQQGSWWCGKVSVTDSCEILLGKKMVLLRDGSELVGVQRGWNQGFKLQSQPLCRDF